ncbi:MAG: hypothetical protein LBL13_00080, partial [Bacteroidales bacterium]|nr:hypothetical protein [Bacteroidales bacterium]
TNVKFLITDFILINMRCKDIFFFTTDLLKVNILYKFKIPALFLQYKYVQYRVLLVEKGEFFLMFGIIFIVYRIKSKTPTLRTNTDAYF